MQIDHCLILGAGLGTRMGNIGKKLPKVLWPVFESTLLELQIQYAKNLGIKNIFLNTHFLSEQIEKFVKDKNLDVELLYEPELLDVGGAIYNVANQESVNYSGNLLIINSDQFLMFDRTYINNALDDLKKSEVVLFGVKVAGDLGYRETIILNNILFQITPPPKDKNWYYTYAGVGIVNLGKLSPKVGRQSFFDTVANYQIRTVRMIIPDYYEYWDFGTLQRYWESSFSALDSVDTMFAHFLRKTDSIVEKKIGESSYNASSGIINLTDSKIELQTKVKAIVLAGNDLPSANEIVYQKIVDFIEFG